MAQVSRTRRRTPAEPPEVTLARVTGQLTGYLESARRAGGRDADVSVRHVLDLLNPGGVWRRVREQPAEAAVEARPEQFPGADPMTGCRPVTPGNDSAVAPATTRRS